MDERAMQRIERKGDLFYRFGNLSRFGEILHFVSSGERSIGFREDGGDAEIRNNRKRLGEAAGFDVHTLVCARQVHSDRVTVAGLQEAGRGALDRESRIPDTDALVTDRPGLCLLVLSADCVPVLLYDPVKRAVAAVHAGWRGTAAGVVARAVDTMQERFGSDPGDLYAGIGPSIGKCCFEVGEEVAAVFREKFPSPDGVVFPAGKPGKSFVDLWEANARLLTGSGLVREHIEIAGLCTCCSAGAFFSYRRTGKEAGRFGAGIMLK